MTINWLTRIKNKAFWVAIIPALCLLIQAGANIFGVDIDLGDIGNRILEFVNAVFAVLVIVGVVNDPNTTGLSDSTRALSYTEPAANCKDETC